MAEIFASLPVCVLKVDLQCCSKCPIDVRNNKLHKIAGVLSVSLDTIKGEVKVRGVMEPHDLKTGIQELGKRAEILTYEKEPMKAKKNKPEKQVKNKKKVQKKIKNHSSSCDSDTNVADESVKNKKKVQKKTKNHSTSCDSDTNVADESVNAEKNPTPLPPNHDGTGNHNACRCGPSSGPPPGCPRPYVGRGPCGGGGPMAAAPPPPPLNSWCPITYCPSPQYLYSRPPPRQNIPLINLYDMYRGQKDAPVGNSGFHTFSDDNVNSCIVM